MEHEFTLTIEQVDYHFKRMEHPDLPLTYHIHFNDWHQRTIFRMRKDLRGCWNILPMPLPAYVKDSEPVFIQAIERNESLIKQ
jgi:hypothetical protein